MNSLTSSGVLHQTAREGGDFGDRRGGERTACPRILALILIQEPFRRRSSSARRQRDTNFRRNWQKPKPQVSSTRSNRSIQRSTDSHLNMATPQAVSNAPAADQGRWLDFHTLFTSSCAALKSDSAEMQGQALSILFTLASNADDNLRSEMGSGSLIQDLTALLSGSFAQEGTYGTNFYHIRGSLNSCARLDSCAGGSTQTLFNPDFVVTLYGPC